MSDIEMGTGDNASDGHPEGYDHDGGMGVEKGKYRADESMGDTSGAENETHDEDDDSEDEEALVEIDPKAILPVKIRPNERIDYASKEAFEKAGLTPADLEKEEEDPEFVNTEEGPEEENLGDHSMQQ